MPVKSYDYPAQVVRVIDADTVILRVREDIDFGFHVTLSAMSEQRFRLARINAPEAHAPGGPEATAYTTQWLGDRADGLRVTSKGQDNYGRWLGELYRGAENLSDALLASGHAVIYT